MRKTNPLSDNTILRAQFSANSGVPDLARIRTYYDETWPDYRLLWMNPDNCAMHFGYWDENTRSHSESLINMNRELARKIGIRPGQRILDAGCGVGGSAIWLAKEYEVEVVGITPVASQIRRARRFARQHGVADRVSFDQQDYTRTAFPDANFDVVWAVESVCHAPDQRLFLKEARRLLRPGGRLGIIDGLRASRPDSVANEKLLHSWLSGMAVPDLATGEELMQWTKDAGFDDAQLINITRNVMPSCQRLYWTALSFLPVAAALRGAGLISEAQYGNWRGARDQYRAVRRGLWFEVIFTTTVV